MKPLREKERAVARQAASLLLGYPDAELLERVPLLRAAAASLPRPVGDLFDRFLDHVVATPLARLQADYVETFDLRRRCCLYLTYYTYGDTRKRGMALLRIKHAYRAAGLSLDDGELSDHLAVVLEFAAIAEPDAGERLLREHRPGLELLRLALEEAGSAYAHVVTAVSRTLPPVDARDRDAVMRLAAQGPPAEEVGLQPYGAAPFAPPDYMPERLGARQ